MPGHSGDPDLQKSKRLAIIKCARSAFIVDGYAGARIEPIAREAGVSTATLYALFEGKSELFAAVIDDAAADFAREMANVRANDGDVRERLFSFALAYAGFMNDPFVRSIFRLVMAERSRFEPTAMHFFDKGRTDFGSTLIGLITEESSRGSLAAITHPSWAAGQLMGMIEHPVFFVPLVTGDEVRSRRPLEEVVTEAVHTFISRYGA